MYRVELTNETLFDKYKIRFRTGGSGVLGFFIFSVKDNDQLGYRYCYFTVFTIHGNSRGFTLIVFGEKTCVRY